MGHYKCNLLWAGTWPGQIRLSQTFCEILRARGLKRLRESSSIESKSQQTTSYLYIYIYYIRIYGSIPMHVFCGSFTPQVDYCESSFAHVMSYECVLWSEDAHAFRHDPRIQALLLANCFQMFQASSAVCITCRSLSLCTGNMIQYKRLTRYGCFKRSLSWSYLTVQGWHDSFICSLSSGVSTCEGSPYLAPVAKRSSEVRWTVEGDSGSN